VAVWLPEVPDAQFARIAPPGFVWDTAQELTPDVSQAMLKLKPLKRLRSVLHQD
jgi:hypothetical protein